VGPIVTSPPPLTEGDSALTTAVPPTGEPAAPVAPVPQPTGSKFPFKALKRPSFVSRSSSTAPSTAPSTALTVETASPAGSRPTTPGGDKEKKKRFRRGKKGRSSEYNLDTSRDMLGIVMLEIVGAENLPKLRNSGLTLTSVACIL
jgi:hypothetical protein